MANIDKFLIVQTHGAGGTLIVRGETVDEKGELVEFGQDAQILVAVIRVGHLTNRADLKVEEPLNNPWVAKTGSHHFNENDEVYAVGAAIDEAGDRPRLFADGFTVTLSHGDGDSPSLPGQ
jgi:hypothetical protein